MNKLTASIYLYFLRGLVICVISFSLFRCEPSPAENKTLTDPAPTVLDFDGNEYPTLRLGDQVWLAENLRVTQAPCEDTLRLRYTDGSASLPKVVLYTIEAPYVARYNADPTAPGLVYNFLAASRCAICPEGYRLPTVADWERLIEHLGGGQAAAESLLPGGESGFNAAPAGRIDGYGSVLRDEIGFYWTSERPGQFGDIKAYTFEIWETGVYRILPQNIKSGNYVRCVRGKPKQ